MAIFHLTTKPLSRSSGRSAVAAAAYRTGTALTDMRQGLTHDYERRFGVEHKELVLPEGADPVYWTRQQLWNAAEFAEARKDGRTAREWQLALPEELSKGERQELALSFARELTGRYGCAVDVGIHLPDKEGDQRNHHAHLLATTRVVAGEGLGDKTLIELSDAKRLSLGLGQGRQEIEEVRALWAERANEALANKGRDERIDSRSLVAQQEEALMAGDIIRAAVLDRMPEIKMGWKATAMERRRTEPVQTDRGDQLRAIRKENTLRQTFVTQIAKLKEALRETAAQVLGKAETIRQQLTQGTRQREAERLREAKRRAEQSKEAGFQAERQSRKQQFRKDVEARAEQLWLHSVDGRSEQNTLRQLQQTQQQEAASLGNLAQARTSLAQWKQEHPVKARFYRHEGFEAEIAAAQKAYGAHKEQRVALQGQAGAFTAKRQESWPQLAQQAERDLQPIAVRLTPGQVRLLLEDAYGGDRIASQQAFTEVEQGTHTVAVLQETVVLQRFEQEGFGATLQQKDKAFLDGRLTQLEQGQKDLRKRRERARERGFGHGE